MKKLFYLFVVVFATTLFTSCEKVDAGHEGILVNLYGDNKGVGQVSMCTGMVW